MPESTQFARPNFRFLALYTLGVLIGCGVLLFAWTMWNLPGSHRKIGGLGFAGLAFAAVSLKEATATMLRFPRLKITGDRITLQWLGSASWAAWTSLGPFYPEPRPFGMDWKNDVISAEILGPDADFEVKKIGKLNIPMRFFAASSKALCAELNAHRNQAICNQQATKP